MLTLVIAAALIAADRDATPPRPAKKQPVMPAKKQPAMPANFNHDFGSYPPTIVRPAVTLPDFIDACDYPFAWFAESCQEVRPGYYMVVFKPLPQVRSPRHHAPRRR